MTDRAAETKGGNQELERRGATVSGPGQDAHATALPVAPGQGHQRSSIAQGVSSWISHRRRTVKSIGMLAFASALATILGVVGSLVQAHFISPVDLGFVRKYSVVAGYAVFLSLGLFIILEREYPVLIGRGEQERARRTAALVQSWCLLAATVVCSALFAVSLGQLVLGRWREASAWFIQIVAVWSTLYVACLSSTFRTTQEFERLAKSQCLSAIASATVLPLFWIWPFPTLVLRSLAGPIAEFLYLYSVRPVKVAWFLPWREFLNLAKQGLRLYISDYLRNIFWSTVEIWLMLRIAGDLGVGLLVFSKIIAYFAAQFSMAINQVHLPRLARRFGESGSIRTCLKWSAKAALLNLGASLLIIVCVWLLSPVVAYAFPRYVQAVPLIRILVLQLLIVSFSLPIYMVTLLDGYLTQSAAVVVGLVMFVGTTLILRWRGLQTTAVAWGTVVGQAGFTMICLLWILVRAKAEGRLRPPEQGLAAVPHLER